MTNKVDVQEVVIDGETYVKKSALPKVSDDYVVVRTYSAGVHAGELVSRNGKEVVLRNARRIWYWEGAASLSQLAMEGVSKPQNCKFAVPVTEITLTEAIEIIPAMDKGIASIKGVPSWRV